MTHFKIKENYRRTPETDAYIKSLVEGLKAQLREKKVIVGQCASTQATLDRDPAKDAEHFFRALDEEAATPKRGPLKEGATMDEYYDWLTGARTVPLDQVIALEKARRGAKNKLGESEKSATTEEKKARAIDAYIFTPPAELTPSEIERVTRIDGIKEIDKLEFAKEVKKESVIAYLLRKMRITGEPPAPTSYMEKQMFFKDLEKDENEN